MRKELRLIFVFIGIVLIVLLVAGTLLVNYARSGAGILLADSGGFILTGSPPLALGQPFTLLITLENIAQRAIMMRPVTFSHDLSPHLYLRQETMKSGPIDDAAGSASGAPQPAVDGVVDGYQVEPRSLIVITLVFAGDAQGIYTIGPVTVHAEVPISLFSIPIQNTYAEYGMLCVQVDQATCTSSEDTFQPE
jgi:hypothetical protein